MENDQKVIELSVKIAAHSYLLGDRGRGEVQVRQSFQFNNGFFEDLGHVAGMEPVVLQHKA